MQSLVTAVGSTVCWWSCHLQHYVYNCFSVWCRKCQSPEDSRRLWYHQGQSTFLWKNLFSCIWWFMIRYDWLFLHFLLLLFRASRCLSLTSTLPPCCPVAWTTGRTTALWPPPLCWRALPGLSAKSQSVSALSRYECSQGPFSGSREAGCMPAV